MALQNELSHLTFLIAHTSILLKGDLQLQPHRIVGVQRVVLVLEVGRKVAVVDSEAGQAPRARIDPLLHDHFLIRRLILRPDDLLSDQTIGQLRREATLHSGGLGQARRAQQRVLLLLIAKAVVKGRHRGSARACHGGQTWRHGDRARRRRRFGREVGSPS